MFHVISEGLNLHYIYKNKLPKYDIISLRKIASNQINKNNFDLILESYKAEYQINEFIGLWNPFTIKNIKELKMKFVKGDNFWGAISSFGYWTQKLKINF